MQPRYENVVIFSPSAVTGGPEALHQLAHAISQLGGRARLAYYSGDNCQCTITRDSITCATPSARCLDAYAMYDPQPLKKHAICDSTLVVFPEILSPIVSNWPKWNRALWWLSVYHAASHNENLRYAKYRRAFFSDKNLTHLYQSDYARSYIVEHGATTIAPLFDYVDRAFFTPNTTEKIHIALFPEKGANLVSLFCNDNKDLSFLHIKGMDREEVAHTLRASFIYIDFGHHPGKDRVPREASAAGAVVFVHCDGAADSYSDYPLDDFYKFTLLDIRSGDLRQRIDRVMADPAAHAARQQYFRQKVALEKEEFYLQVKAIFFRAN